MINSKKIPLFLTLLLLSALSFQAIANENIRKIELSTGNVTHIPGTEIKLKLLIHQSRTVVDYNTLQLLAVEVVAKSREGNGTIRLRVGNNLSEWSKVAGTQGDFDNLLPESYTSIKIRSPDAGIKQGWQLILNGYIKIRKIILYTTTAPPVAGSI